MNSDRARKRYARSIFGDRDGTLESVLRFGLLEMKCPTIQVDDTTGRILQLLTLLRRPALAIEIGSLFGYSTVYIARGLPPGGRLVSLEIDAKNAAIARRSAEIAGVADRVEILNADALTYFADLQDSCVDMVFIDASKKSYPDYLKAILRKIRSGSLIVADDAFADRSFTPTQDAGGDNSAELRGIHRYNSAIGKAPTFFSALVPTETGLMVSIRT